MQRRQVVKTRWSALRLAILFGAAAVAPLDAQRAGMNHSVTPPAAQAVPRPGAIHIAGKLDEAAWTAATPVTQFIQSDPQEGKRSLGDSALSTRLSKHAETLGGNNLTSQRRHR